MREYLFRGKRTDNDKWVYGHYVFQKKRNGCFGQTITDRDFDRHYIVTPRGESFEVIPETVGQYTGLTDKNDTKIFEGDIITFGDNIYKIVFENGSFALCDESGGMIWKIGGHNDYCYSLLPLHFDCCWKENHAYDIEVISNIYDSPELLKGE